MQFIKNIESLGNKRTIWLIHELPPLPKEFHHQWLFLPLIERDDNFSKIADWAVDNRLAYACCLGSLGEKLHDWIDETYVYREMKLIEGDIPNVLPLTTWHNNINEGLDFALYSTNHPDTPIKNIICLSNFSKNEFLELFENISTE